MGTILVVGNFAVPRGNDKRPDAEAVCRPLRREGKDPWGPRGAGTDGGPRTSQGVGKAKQGDSWLAVGRRRESDLPLAGPGRDAPVLPAAAGFCAGLAALGWWLASGRAWPWRAG